MYDFRRMIWYTNDHLTMNLFNLIWQQENCENERMLTGTLFHKLTEYDNNEIRK